GGGTIVTPHAGEWQRLTGRPATYREVREERSGLALTVLLKGAPSFVIADEVVAVTSGGPELATIGTGDVLAGMIGALLARGLDAPMAARSAAYWHGIAGAHLAARGTVTADRLVDEVGRWAW
nr:bifunctional ADP-dependent NAD(P)H-hydrate dehydratase/NAD(P)H-hydrate epimerase [Actinomycetota bacterium]NIU71237.1 bifunctional ADP-dependent NAD(P)H-hydrate dehydratase/NAD(P)H-hydrate epimerase [Actinomycetota bacterium]NIV90694.1 bifunctional ADP-dependent NAD(P)H-hydrate dehydratase/NAD(P)H-hydrate epimerase [Actinomycetota bacterium]NIW33192.1 bifunctional ADP-dependent NAD(P)H-hydrate dehydratase/NAD(P)H-hydrate epimerase [Actinomycetota bacterium]